MRVLRSCATSTHSALSKHTAGQCSDGWGLMMHRCAASADKAQRHPPGPPYSCAHDSQCAILIIATPPPRRAQCREMAAEEEKAEDANGESSEAKLQALQRELEAKRQDVAAWCRTSYGEAFAAWVHICAVRLFVESVLRYGLPPQFLGALVQPGGKAEGKVRKALASEFGSHGADMWEAEEGGAGDGKDMYPYVSFTLDIDN